MASLVLLFWRAALFNCLEPGSWRSASFLSCQWSSSSRSESSSSSCSATSPFMLFEFRMCITPSRDRFWVMENLLIMSLCLKSYKQTCLEFPPPITNSPALGLTEIALKCLFFVEFLAVTLSPLSLPPATSSRHSITPMRFPDSASHIWICPLRVAVTTSLSFWRKETESTSELWLRVSTSEVFELKMSHTREVLSQEPLTSKLPVELKAREEMGPVCPFSTSRIYPFFKFHT
mmetsp:Transcript_4442/g.4182  ORF Transcript_4442/g.4182 Transcript_4442/m.4182 type:complete len:233 (-) Transcript_4442:200-898(-)